MSSDGVYRAHERRFADARIARQQGGAAFEHPAHPLHSASVDGREVDYLVARRFVGAVELGCCLRIGVEQVALRQKYRYRHFVRLARNQETVDEFGRRDGFGYGGDNHRRSMLAAMMCDSFERFDARRMM